MTFYVRCTVAVGSILALSAVPAFAAEQMSSTDMKFANAAAMGGIAEVQAAHLAEQKASSPEVKQFALEMDKDHTQANAELMQIAETKGLTAPTEPDAAHKQAAQHLSMLSGAQFDQQYVQGQVADHRTTVALFQQEANSGQDPQLKQYAQKYLPILQHHLQMAESIKLSS